MVFPNFDVAMLHALPILYLMF